MVNEMQGLMKLWPFLGVCYVIAGLASLGLPGLSGFVAEMTIFVGAFQIDDVFHRVITIIAITSIVAAAVYILRVVGKMLMGPTENEETLKDFPDATWYEKLSVLALIIPIIAMGVAPLWLSDTVMESIEPIIQRLTAINL